MHLIQVEQRVASRIDLASEVKNCICYQRSIIVSRILEQNKNVTTIRSKLFISRVTRRHGSVTGFYLVHATKDSTWVMCKKSGIAMWTLMDSVQSVSYV